MRNFTIFILLLAGCVSIADLKVEETLDCEAYIDAVSRREMAQGYLLIGADHAPVPTYPIAFLTVIYINGRDAHFHTLTPKELEPLTDRLTSHGFEVQGECQVNKTLYIHATKTSNIKGEKA